MGLPQNKARPLTRPGNEIGRLDGEHGTMHLGQQMLRRVADRDAPDAAAADRAHDEQVNAVDLNEMLDGDVRHAHADAPRQVGFEVVPQFVGAGPVQLGWQFSSAGRGT